MQWQGMQNAQWAAMMQATVENPSEKSSLISDNWTGPVDSESWASRGTAACKPGTCPLSNSQMENLRLQQLAAFQAAMISDMKQAPMPCASIAESGR